MQFNSIQFESMQKTLLSIKHYIKWKFSFRQREYESTLGTKMDRKVSAVLTNGTHAWLLAKPRPFMLGLSTGECEQTQRQQDQCQQLTCHPAVHVLSRLQ